MVVSPEQVLTVHPELHQVLYLGLPCWLSGQESACQGRSHGFDP